MTPAATATTVRPITDEDCLVIRALHALPPEKQQAVKTLLNIKPKKNGNSESGDN